MRRSGWCSLMVIALVIVRSSLADEAVMPVADSMLVPMESPTKPETAPAAAPLSAASPRTAWSDASNLLRPFKGVRRDSAGQLRTTVVWVLCTPEGRPISVGDLGDAKLNLYFKQRIMAELSAVAQHRELSSDQIEKLKLAAELDVARLQRLAHQVQCDLELARNDQAERAANQLLHTLSLACNQRLFAEGSLFARVLQTESEVPSPPEAADKNVSAKPPLGPLP